jgi:hypothetical protein
MFKRSLSRIGDIAKSRTCESSLLKNSTLPKVEQLRKLHGYKPESNPQDSILNAKPHEKSYPGSPAPDPRWSETRGISPTENPGQADRQNKSESDSERSILDAKPYEKSYPGSPAPDPRA